MTVPGLVGLAISYALSITNLLSGVVTSFTETEKQMVSVERAQDYIRNIPNERTDGSLMVRIVYNLFGKLNQMFDYQIADNRPLLSVCWFQT